MIPTELSPPPPATVTCDAPGSWLQFRTSAGFERTRMALPIADLPPDLVNFRILHLTDLHVRKRWDPAYDALISQVEHDKPDLIVFTGDFVENRFSHRPGLGNVLRLFEKLNARLGVIGILGNHDGDLLAPALARFKHLTMIDHRRLLLTSGDASLELIGLAGVDRRDLDKRWMRSLGTKPPGSVRIVLSHYPDSILLSQYLQPDLFLAGHTHGGQICLPGRTPIFRHDSLQREYCHGVHRAFGTWMVVNRGFGFSSMLPLRLFCPAEIIEIRLVRA